MSAAEQLLLQVKAQVKTVTEAIRVENLVKKFGSLVAVDDISFSVEQGRDFRHTRPQRGGQDHYPGDHRGASATQRRTYLRAGHEQP